VLETPEDIQNCSSGSLGGAIASNSLRKLLMRRTTAVVGLLVFLCSVVPSATAKENSRVYQSGKLLDVDVQSVSRGTAVIGSMAAPIPGLLYVFQIQCDDLVYFANYSAGKLSYKPLWVVNDPIDFRLDKDKMFLKRPDGKELEVRVVKRIRVTKEDNPAQATPH
jgi:hypothetical protein